MGFLTIINYIAMGIGYIILVLAILFFTWMFVGMINEKRERKKWEKESVDKEKVDKVLEKEKQESSISSASSNPDQQDTEQQQSTTQTEKKEEKLVDESGQLKMVD